MRSEFREQELRKRWSNYECLVGWVDERYWAFSDDEDYARTIAKMMELAMGATEIEEWN